MSDYLTNLAARSLDRSATAAVQPRLALLFEPPPTNASEPSSQLETTTPPADSYSAATHATDGATAQQATFSSATTSPPSPSPRETSLSAFDSPAFPTHTTPSPLEDDRHDAAGDAQPAPDASTRDPRTSQEAPFSSSARQLDTEHGGAPQASLPASSISQNAPPPTDAALLIPPHASRLTPPYSPETAATHASESHSPEARISETGISESHTSEETRPPHAVTPTPPNDTRRAALTPQLSPTPTPLSTATPSSASSSSFHIRPNDAPLAPATEAMTPATRHTPAAFDSGARDASGHIIRQPLEDAARHAITGQLSTPTGAPRSSSSGASQSPESAPQSLLVPTSPNIATNATGAINAGASSISLRGSETAASRDALRVQVRVPAPAPADATAKPDATPTIHVSIGRIEVRAVAPPAPPAPRPSPARPAPKMSLDDYLRAHNGGRK